MRCGVPSRGWSAMWTPASRAMMCCTVRVVGFACTACTANMCSPSLLHHLPAHDLLKWRSVCFVVLSVWGLGLHVLCQALVEDWRFTQVLIVFERHHDVRL